MPFWYKIPEILKTEKGDSIRHILLLFASSSISGVTFLLRPIITHSISDISAVRMVCKFAKPVIRMVLLTSRVSTSLIKSDAKAFSKTESSEIRVVIKLPSVCANNDFISIETKFKLVLKLIVATKIAHVKLINDDKY